MKIIKFEEKNIYKILRQHDFNHINTAIGIYDIELISQDWFNRIYVNQWYKNNAYYYVVKEINKNELINLNNGLDIFNGVVFDLSSQFNNIEILKEVFDYCAQNGLIIFVVDNNNDSVNNLCGEKGVTVIKDPYEL